MPGEPDVPLPAEWLGFLGIVLVVAGTLMGTLRLAWAAWEAWRWWAGLAYAGVGIGLLVVAVVSAWLYTTGVPAARHRWHTWRLERERRKRQREQEQAAQEGQP